jgi:hypothetical protein
VATCPTSPGRHQATRGPACDSLYALSGAPLCTQAQYHTHTHMHAHKRMQKVGLRTRNQRGRSCGVPCLMCCFRLKRSPFVGPEKDPQLSRDPPPCMPVYSGLQDAPSGVVLRRGRSAWGPLSILAATGQPPCMGVVTMRPADLHACMYARAAVTNPAAVVRGTLARCCWPRACQSQRSPPTAERRRSYI